MTDTPQPASADEILVETADGVALLTLNRPHALNALSHGMVVAIRERLEDWAQDDAVRAVVVRGAGERGLCAGGDVVSLRQRIVAGHPEEAMEYFRDEYRMNHLISVFPKPYVAFMDGFVLGGGVGVSAHGTHRVATERTRLGMPETGIGFTPDVGGSWLLARAPHRLGRHLGLTSEFATGADAVALGFADVLVPSGSLDAVLADLRAALRDADAGQETADAVDAVLARHAQDPGEAPLLTAAAWLEQAYGHDTAAEVIAALEAVAAEHEDEAAREHARTTAETLRAKSPTSVAVTLEALRRLEARTGEAGRREGARLGLEQEFDVAAHMVRGHDMPEGIRAQLVDKDRSPQWSPARVEDVTAEDVAAHFAPAPDGPLRLG
ncbi:enoyl-CoA hydratase/isomerase family protein [Micrococcus sp.]|uniref:enoyl-CoA hydratase/isomerase family protein n=1 Tax=Micrococcus sp. TaxID=1271 RepID=UPI002A90F1EF|nr:enoyl-CoA hydratase/isomerase family protein [Micrococcus sp.]MDY6056099.1 enoyl-CoA hydratase/isomerase family protein [Micrococcus sp.]